MSKFKVIFNSFDHFTMLGYIICMRLTAFSSVDKIDCLLLCFRNLPRFWDSWNLPRFWDLWKFTAQKKFEVCLFIDAHGHEFKIKGGASKMSFLGLGVLKISKEEFWKYPKGGGSFIAILFKSFLKIFLGWMSCHTPHLYTSTNVLHFAFWYFHFVLHILEQTIYFSAKKK